MAQQHAALFLLLLRVALASKHSSPAVGHATPPPPAAKAAIPPPPELSFVGCFAADSAHPFAGAGMWPVVQARGRMTTRQCATVCVDSPWFAMQRGFCQCSAEVRLTRVLPATECGAPCAGEVDARPTSYCADSPAGSSARDAVYTQTTDCGLLGAYVQLDSPLAPVQGQNQWKGAIKVQHWQEGAIIDLDWGIVKVELSSVWNANFFDSAHGRARTV